MATGIKDAVTAAFAYEGWTMAAIGFTCMLFAFGASTATMPLIYGQVIDEFGWSRTDATLIFTYKNISAAAMALFFVGPLFERFGLRRMMFTSFVVTGFAMIAFLWVQSLWSYCLVGVALGLGVSTVFIGAKVLVSRWFARNQGLAIAITLAGSSAAGVLFPVLGASLISWVGWRATFALLSLGIWFIALPLYLLKAKDDPREADILLEITRKPPEGDLAQKIRKADPAVSFGRVVLTPVFWVIVLCILLVAAVDAGVTQHTILFLEREAKLSTVIAAAGMSAILGVGLLAKIVAGKAFDTFSIKGISIWYLLLALSVAAAFPVQGLATLSLFVVLRGFAHGGLMAESAVIAKHRYGPRLLNSTIPVFLGFWSIGAAAGPLVLSEVYDRFGSYEYGFWLFIAASLVGAVLLYHVRPFYRERLLAIIYGAPKIVPASERRSRLRSAWVGSDR